MMPFACYFSLDFETCCCRNITSVNWCLFCIHFCWMREDGFYFHPTISHPQPILHGNQFVIESIIGYLDLIFDQYSLTLDFWLKQEFWWNIDFWLTTRFWFWTSSLKFQYQLGLLRFLILDLMVKISILVGFSPFSIGVGVFLIMVPTTESWFLILNCGFWISIPSIKNEFFFPIPYAFSKVTAWNPILVLPMTLPLSIIDSNPLETIMSYNW